jgi:hypothetical protein
MNNILECPRPIKATRDFFQNSIEHPPADIPVLACKRVGVGTQVLTERCPYCTKPHWHGIPDEGTEPTHRAAHCVPPTVLYNCRYDDLRKQWSEIIRRGYYIRLVT